jgi:transposase
VNPALYACKKAYLAELEKLSEQKVIDLYYADESSVSSEGYVPYGWQFKGENISVPSSKGYKINLFGLITRDNKWQWASTEKNIDSKFIIEQIDRFSLTLVKQTFLVLDNARIHVCQSVRERMRIWQSRGLFFFFLPPYCPHLNLAETVWRKMKTQCLRPEDYRQKDSLFYAVNRCMANIGKEIKIHFSPFNIN